MRKLALLVLLVVFGGSSGASAVPIEWTVASGGNGHFYEVISAPGMFWGEAHANALLLGSGWNLAAVTSQEEQDFIASLLPTSPFQREQYWLGGYQPIAVGSWEWTNGSAFVYTDWWSGEPNDLNGVGLDWVALDWRSDAWHWNDLSNHSSNGPFISGYVVSTVPEPNTALLLGFGLVGLGVKRRQRLAALH
jgi:hypothetical protein